LAGVLADHLNSAVGHIGSIQIIKRRWRLWTVSPLVLNDFLGVVFALAVAASRSATILSKAVRNFCAVFTPQSPV
jgi:hypothetical protein